MTTGEEKEEKARLEFQRDLHDPKKGSLLGAHEIDWMGMSSSERKKFLSAPENQVIAIMLTKGFGIVSGGKWMTRKQLFTRCCLNTTATKYHNNWDMFTNQLAFLLDSGLAEHQAKGKKGEIHFKFPVKNWKHLL